MSYELKNKYFIKYFDNWGYLIDYLTNLFISEWVQKVSLVSYDTTIWVEKPNLCHQRRQHE